MKKVHLLFYALLFGVSAANAQINTDGDVTVMHMPTLAHDSNTCSSTGAVMYNITVLNSSIYDTIRVVDIMSQQLIYTTSNVMGQATWNLMVPVPLFTPVIPDHQLMGNMAMFMSPDIKVIVDLDTVMNLGNFYPLTVNDPCEYGNVTGRVYIDNNNDCQYNTGDVPLNMAPVQANANLNNTVGIQSNAVFTDTAGMYYHTTVQESWMDDVDVFLGNDFAFLFPFSTCFNGSYNFNSLPQTGADFPLQCSSSIDVQNWAGGPSNIRPAIPFTLFPTVSNTGCDIASGTLTLVVDPEVTYDLNQTYPAPDYVSGDTLVWNYANLTNLSNGAYWNSMIAGVHLTPDNTLQIGDSACFRVYTNVPTNDVNAANNDYSFCLPVVNSYDPNMKEVMPKGEGVNGNIPPTTASLTYTIHFQNTGTAMAFNVNILDTLDADIDQSSLKIISTSHNMHPVWVAPGVLQFNFWGINLLDSNTNEAASHGSVTFSVKLNSNLPIGTQIKNTAHIVFDNNTPIVTNTALNTIAWPTGINTTSANSNVKVYPNPAVDNIFIESNGLNNGKAYISDISGQLVNSYDISSDKQKIDVSKLPAGVYLLKVTGDNTSLVRKFVKQ